MVDTYQTELEILGAALSRGITPDVREAWETLTPEMFKPGNAEIFTAIWQLHKAGLVIEPRTVAAKCSNPGEAIGYCEELSQGQYGYQITAYAKQLRILHNAAKASKQLAQLSQLIATDFENTEQYIVDLQKITDTLITKRQRSRQNVMDGMTAFLDLFEQRFEGNADAIGLDIGLDMPIERNDLMVIGGQPGMGKTALMQYVVTKLAEQGHHSLIFSLEMKFKELYTRIVARESQIDSDWISDPKGLVRTNQAPISAEEEERRINTMMAALSNKVENMDIMIDDTPFLSLPELHNTVREYLMERPDTKMICIDYLTLMEMPKAARTDLEIAQVTRACKLMAKEFDVPFVILSQLNRESDKQRREPTIRDLKDSSAIEQDADKVIFPYRPKMHEPDDPLHGYAKIIKGKVRGGKVGSTALRFNNGNFYEMLEGETVDFDQANSDSESEINFVPKNRKKYSERYAKK